MSHPQSAQIDKMKTVAIEINIACIGWLDEEEMFRLTLDAITAICTTASLDYPNEAVVSLLFSDDNEICRLNKQFRNIDRATNVLSFPCEQIEAGGRAGEILGDLAFALQTINTEAEYEQNTLKAHLSHLIIHGFLHLFGYDHINDKDAELMEALEIAALASLGISNPYLAPWQQCEI